MARLFQIFTSYLVFARCDIQYDIPVKFSLIDKSCFTSWFEERCNTFHSWKHVPCNFNQSNLKISLLIEKDWKIELIVKFISDEVNF